MRARSPGRAELARRHPLENERGAPVVGIDRAHLLGRGASRLQVTGLQRRLCGGQQPFEEAAEHRLRGGPDIGHQRHRRAQCHPVSWSPATSGESWHGESASLSDGLRSVIRHGASSVRIGELTAARFRRSRPR